MTVVDRLNEIDDSIEALKTHVRSLDGFVTRLESNISKGTTECKRLLEGGEAGFCALPSLC